ncbi:DUF7563 family protein [Natrinema saccharevitans]
MPECHSCGAFVTADFVRVFSVDGERRTRRGCQVDYQALSSVHSRRSRDRIRTRCRQERLLQGSL